MTVLGNGLHEVACDEGALSVREATLSTLRRLGASEENKLIVQSNLANTYRALGRDEQALRLRREVYYGTLRLHGEEHRDSLREANNYAVDLCDLQRHAEAKSLLRKQLPVARRVLGDDDISTLRMRMTYGRALYKDDGATLDDLREAVTTLEEIERTARRVFGGTHPLTRKIEDRLRESRFALESGAHEKKDAQLRLLRARSYLPYAAAALAAAAYLVM